MYILKLLVILGSVHGLLGQVLSEEAGVSSEENAGQEPGAKGTSCPCGWTNKQGRIIGGKQAQPNEFPLMAGIAYKSRRPFCGGSIITEKHILTAAHCTVEVKDDVNGLFVFIGTNEANNDINDIQTIDVDHTIEHEGYDPETYAHDIAIAVLKSSIQFSKTVGPVCLPTGKTNLLDKYIKAIGWGYTNSRRRLLPDHLMKVNLRVVPTESCQFYKENLEYHVNKDNQICTLRNDKDTCKGDSGGPLVWNDPETNRLTQVGIVSYGVRLCGTKSAVNTNVMDYLAWIQDKVAGTAICQKI